MKNCQGRSKAGKFENQTTTELKRNTNKNIYIDMRCKKAGGRHRFLFKSFRLQFERTGEVHRFF